MCQLIETIKCEDGKLFNMEFHQARFKYSIGECFGYNPVIHLLEEIKVPELAKTGLFRCRVTYSEIIEKVEFIPYLRREIKSLKLIEDNEIDYHFKFADRNRLNTLFEKREICDDIIIVKNGCITDSSFANIVFHDGFSWLTPDTPLLKGTQRAKLLKDNKIKEVRISPPDLKKFEKAGLINAFNDLEEMPFIDIKDINF